MLETSFSVFALYEKYGEHLPGGFYIKREKPDYYDLCEDGVYNAGRINLICDGEVVNIIDVTKDHVTVQTQEGEIVGLPPEFMGIATFFSHEDLL